MGRVFSPFVEYFHVAGVDIADAYGLCDYGFIICQGDQFYVSRFESLGGHVEPVSVGCHHAAHFATVVADGFYGFQETLPCLKSGVPATAAAFMLLDEIRARLVSDHGAFWVWASSIAASGRFFKNQLFQSLCGINLLATPARDSVN